MAAKVKGFFKEGFRHVTEIFVVKEPEMEIGFPTDVKHVAHIGWDGGSSVQDSPSWMNDFKTSESKPAEQAKETADEVEHEKPRGTRQSLPTSEDGSVHSDQNQKAPKKKRKKHKGSSDQSSSTRSSRTSKLKASQTNAMGDDTDQLRGV
ncbi:CRIB domain-containing protein RIC10 isoform X1 [Canna indica]|uniref:CRIB domain-containing protein RIC10 isoform X1 n=1 Tax=Canna indica TaxID=4628 RepID=A0AAQ3KTZ3_9LILI|nr:CRIB domain-containing protein RIC10 isoform X1 [Canna indica]